MESKIRNQRVIAIENALKEHGYLSFSVDEQAKFNLEPELSLDMAVFNNEPIQIPLVVFHLMSKGHIPDDRKIVTNTLSKLSSGEMFRADYIYDGKVMLFKIQLRPSEISGVGN